MASDVEHVSIRIDRPADEVYAYVSDPSTLPEWAAGLSGSITFRDGEWVAESPFGEVTVRFADTNEYGVLDHWVTTSAGERFYNPFRVIPFGDASVAVFSVARRPGMTDDEFQADVAAVTTDLAVLKGRLELV